jgi:gag-polyprotein putative aspartyl protease
MNKMLKPLAIAAMSIAMLTPANAIELTCGTPRIYVGQQSHDAKDTVTNIDVKYVPRIGWQVHHRMGNGLIAEREYQYNIRDESNQNQTQWRGTNYNTPIITMVGEIRRMKDGQPVYAESLYVKGQLRMQAASFCTEQVAALPPPVVTTPPAPPPVVVQQPAPQLPPIIVNVPPQPAPAAKPAPVVKRDSVPITVYRDKAAMLDVGMGSQTVSMMIDTGASESVVTNDVADALIRSGQGRWTGIEKYQMADGSVTEAQTLTIYQMRIGNHVVRNVKASTVPNGAIMLIGFPVLDQIGPFTINTRTRELVFETTNANAVDDATLPPG